MRYVVAMLVSGIAFLAYLEVQPYGVTYEETCLLVSFWIYTLTARAARVFILDRSEGNTRPELTEITRAAVW